MSNQPVQAEGGLGDRVKVACAVVAILAGIVGFYLLAGQANADACWRSGGVLSWCACWHGSLRRDANSLHLQKNPIVRPIVLSASA